MIAEALNFGIPAATRKEAFVLKFSMHTTYGRTP